MLHLKFAPETTAMEIATELVHQYATESDVCFAEFLNFVAIEGPSVNEIVRAYAVAKFEIDGDETKIIVEGRELNLSEYLE